VQQSEHVREGVSAPPSRLALECLHLSKAFPGVIALDDVSMQVAGGTVHALLGENGAGKSTLIKIITGVQAPDSGTVTVRGQQLRHATPRSALQLGIRVIHQERQIAQDLTIGDNVLLDKFPTNRWGFVSRTAISRRAQRHLDALGIDLDARRPASELSAAQQQLVELARAVRDDTTVLVMDEPTASLRQDEVGVLFTVMRNLVASDVAIVYISHHLHEVFEIADTATVLRNGRHVEDVVVTETTRDRLVTAMFGREIAHTRLPRERPAVRAVKLHAEAVALGNILQRTTLDVRGGEVLALCGAAGSGASELAEALAGVKPPTQGTVTSAAGGRIRSRHGATGRGIAFLPADRKKAGLLLDRSITENLQLGLRHHGIDRFAYVPRAMKKTAGRETAARDIKVADVDQPIKSLSGGNQQRVIFARWVMAGSEIFVLDQPTAGVDVNAKFVIYDEILSLTAGGAAVVIVSSDYEEICCLADRVLVMREGSVVAEIDGDDATPESLYKYEMGEERGAAG
jgi:ABC-type sugar transport system ATPase subunit